MFVTAHDLNRLEKYAQNMVDYHMVMDLLPTLARLYFTRRLDVGLNELKSVCNVAVIIKAAQTLDGFIFH